MRANYYKLGSCASTIYFDNDKVYKTINLSSNDDIKAIQKGIEVINNSHPKSILNPIDINFEKRRIGDKEFIECKYEQPIQKPWISHKWISSIQLFELASLILSQEEILINNNLTFVDARASNYHLINNLKLIDLGSFKYLNKHSYYSFETDFANNFLTPLLLEKKLKISIGNYFEGNLDSIGINTLDLNNFLLNPNYYIFNFKRFLNDFISTKISQSNSEFVDFLLKEESNLPSIDPKKVLRKIKKLKELLSISKPLTSGQTKWSEYSSFHSKEYMKKKAEKIEDFLNLVPSNSSTIDLGSNIGSLKFKKIKAFIDKDIDVCNFLRLNVDTSQIVLCRDIAEELLKTMQNKDSQTLNLNGNIDNAIVMSLLHHIIIDSGLNAKAFYAALSKLYKKVLLEFITDEDPMIKFLLKKKGEPVNWSWSYHSNLANKFFKLTEPVYLSETRFVLMMSKKD